MEGFRQSDVADLPLAGEGRQEEIGYDFISLGGWIDTFIAVSKVYLFIQAFGVQER